MTDGANAAGKSHPATTTKGEQNSPKWKGRFLSPTCGALDHLKSNSKPDLTCISCCPFQTAALWVQDKWKSCRSAAALDPMDTICLLRCLLRCCAVEILLREPTCPVPSMSDGFGQNYIPDSSRPPKTAAEERAGKRRYERHRLWRTGRGQLEKRCEDGPSKVMPVSQG